MIRILMILVCASALVFGACSGGSDGGASGDIDMTNGQRFEPEEFTASVGDSVVWVNGSSEAHTVTAYEDDPITQ